MNLLIIGEVLFYIKLNANTYSKTLNSDSKLWHKVLV